MLPVKPAVPAPSAPLPGSADTITARWSVGHACAMLASLAVCVWTEEPWVLMAYGAVSFAVYTLWMRGHWSAQAGFGAANRVTSVRLALALFMLAGHSSVPALALAALGLLILTLDGVDGHLARKHRTTGVYGATYDVEVDAFYTTTLALLLVNTHGVAGWVTLVGAWRYVYLLVGQLVPPRQDRASTRFGRYSYGISIACLSLALVVPDEWAVRLAAVATLVTSASFLTSFWQRYARTNGSTERSAAACDG